MLIIHFARHLAGIHSQRLLYANRTRSDCCMGQWSATLRKDLDLSDPAQSNLIHFTPLRYPGGKAKLAAYIKSLFKDNRLLDGEYVEP